jgi:hypothetical protein
MLLAVVVAAKGRPDLAKFIRALVDAGATNECHIIVAHDEAIAPESSSLSLCLSLVPCARESSVFQLWGKALARASARYVAIMDAHCPPASTWFAGVARAIEEPLPAFFGPVSCRRGPTSSTIGGYLIEYAQFGRPVARTLQEVPGNNFVFRRDLLDARALQGGEFHKTFFVERLRRGGVDPVYRDDVEVIYEKRFETGHYLRRRFAHGRSFAALRSDEHGHRAMRFLALLTPTLPLLRVYRIARAVFRKPHLRRALIRRLPFVLCAETAWSMGEGIGYVTARAGATRDLD